MKKSQLFQFISIMITCALLTSCATPPMYYDSQDNVSNTKDKISQDRKAIDQQAKSAEDAVVYKDSMYVDNQAINLSEQPTWLNNKITVHGSSLPFSFYSRQVITDPNVITTYQTDLEQNKPITLNYTGSVEGALQVLSAKTGYTYEIHNNGIYWQEYITKTFDIAFLPGDAEYLVGKSTGGSSSSGGSASSGGSGSSSATVIQGSPGNADDEYNNIQGKMSVWDDMGSTIKSMLSKNGSVIISQSTTSVTVHDTPERVQAIAAYIKQLNTNLSKEVMIKVQVLDISLDKAFNYGINWALAAKFIGESTFKFNGNFSQPISLSPLSGAGASATGMGVTSASGSSVLINALSQQGTVSVATEPTIVTTNNQVASLNLLSQVGYLAQIANTSSDSQQSGGQTQTTLTPGSVSTGLTLYILPKVIGNHIYMQISSDLSDLLEIRDLYSSTSTTGASTTIDQVQNMIQVPDINSKSFNQRSIVKSGTTLILAGFTQLTNQANESKMFGSAALGGKGAEQKDEETIVLVTPYILNSND